MRPNDMVLRCFAEKVGNQWQAFCIDLNLAAQADTFPQAKEKLESMVSSYLYDIFEGDDKEHAEDLFPRLAPLSIRIKYAKYWALDRVRNAVRGPVKRHQRRAEERKRAFVAFKQLMPAHFNAA